MSGRASSLSSVLPRKEYARSQISKMKSWISKSSSRAPISSLEPKPQLESRFLNALPLEIRHQIYGHVVDSFGSVQHILLVSGRLTHMRCDSTTFQQYSSRTSLCMTHDPTYRQGVQNGWEIMPLLRSCRQMCVRSLHVLGTHYSS